MNRIRNSEAGPARRFEVIDGGPSLEQQVREERIKARLQGLIDTVDQFVESLPAALLAEESSAQEILQELAVKQAALEWIVRVAHHCSGTVRERLWKDIELSLEALERTARALPRLGTLSRFAHIHGGPEHDTQYSWT
jgi:hypothetical protein